MVRRIRRRFSTFSKRIQNIALENVRRQLRGQRITQFDPLTRRFSDDIANAFFNFRLENPTLARQIDRAKQGRLGRTAEEFDRERQLGRFRRVGVLPRVRQIIRKPKVISPAPKRARAKITGVVRADTGEVQPAQRGDTELRLGRFRERIRQKKLTGRRLTPKEELGLVTATFSQSIVSFGKGVVKLPSSLLKLAKDPKQILKIPAAINQEGKKFGKLLRTSPTEAFAQIGAEIFILKGTGKALKIIGKLGDGAAARLSPKFTKIRGGAIRLTIAGTKKPPLKPIGKVKGTKGTIKGPPKKTVSITVGGTVKKISEPLKKQIALEGKKVTAVSAQANKLVNIIKTRRIVRKPIPQEALLGERARFLLRRFDKATISKKQIIELDTLIRIETKGQGSLLERSFFADPKGRFRPSRLGLRQEDASLLDFLTGDITFKANKPQILVFSDVTIEKLPKALQAIQKKLKAGKSLTPTEARKLLAFQLKKSGKFKPIGALSKEPEITLAPGEIIKKVKKIGVTIIDGRRVPIIQAKVVKAVGRTKTLLRKSKAGKIKSKELKELTKRLNKETGFKSSLSRSTRTRRRVRIPKPLVRRVGRITRARRIIRTVRRTVRRTPVRKTRITRTPRRTTRRTTTRIRPRPTGRITRVPGRPTVSRTPTPIIRPKAKTPTRIKTKKKAKKKQGFNVFAKPVKGKRLIKINRRPLTKTKAEDLRNFIIDTSLSRTGKIKKTSRKPKTPKIKVTRNFAKRTNKKFRRFRIIKGKRRRLRTGKVIERSRRLLDTRQERKKITLRKRIKQLRRLRRKAKRR